jgi:hypothetical protein
MQYELDISIDENSVKSIGLAGQAVTIVKVVNSYVSTAGSTPPQGPNPGYPPVAWLEFQPWESNTVIWTEAYEVYASTNGLPVYRTIQPLSSSEQAQLGWMYTLQSNMFTGAQGGGCAAKYNITNAQGKEHNFGLSQQATVNGNPTATFVPLNSIPVLNNQQARFSPTETVSIFLSTYIGYGTLLSEVPEQALTVTLTSQSPSANIGFNDSNNTFYLS